MVYTQKILFHKKVNDEKKKEIEDDGGDETSKSVCFFDFSDSERDFSNVNRWSFRSM